MEIVAYFYGYYFPVHIVRVVPLKIESTRQEMSLEQRQCIYVEKNKLAEIFSVNKSTISMLIKKFQKGKNFENSSYRGREILMDERDNSQLRKNMRQTLNEISIDYNKHAPQFSEVYLFMVLKDIKIISRHQHN